MGKGGNTSALEKVGITLQGSDHVMRKTNTLCRIVSVLFILVSSFLTLNITKNCCDHEAGKMYKDLIHTTGYSCCNILVKQGGKCCEKNGNIFHVSIKANVVIFNKIFLNVTHLERR